jgi:glycosyltransferase involved in cell wall biosynthesis
MRATSISCDEIRGSMTRRVLYISFTGLMDPLGQSQVLQYALGLGRSGHQVTVLSFEKPDALAERAQVLPIRRFCEEADVDWWPRVRHKRPFRLFAMPYSLVSGLMQGIRIVREAEAEIVHCRSYIGSLLGLVIKRATGAQLIFDMRGFWPDERVDGGIWKANSMRYRAFKWIERRLFLGADHVVSLTNAGKREIEKFDYLQGRMPPISVIPTCTNLEIFKPMRQERAAQGSFTLGYVGSAGSWYMFEEVARAVRLLFEARPDARFLVINKGDHDAIRAKLRDADVDLDRVEIVSAPYSEVARHIGRMNAGIFFIKPVWSKRASSPTRLGEFLGCGKPVLANGGVGDVEEALTETGTGIAINRFDPETLGSALEQLITLSAEPDIVGRCRSAAEERFSLDLGVAEYDRIYRSLEATQSDPSTGRAA